MRKSKWVFPKIVVPPKSSILIGFSITNHPFWGPTIVGNPQMHGFSWLVGGWTNPKDSVWEDFLEPFWEDEGIWPKIYNELVGFFPTPFEKYAQVKMEKSSPNLRGETSKQFENRENALGLKMHFPRKRTNVPWKSMVGSDVFPLKIVSRDMVVFRGVSPIGKWVIFQLAMLHPKVNLVIFGLDIFWNFGLAMYASR